MSYLSYFGWRRMVWSTIFAAIPSSLYAVDGVVLIDQSHALAGNVTPGDAPGFPVTISQSGSYRLSGNLVVPDVTSSGIQITAPYVTLDLNGFGIIGPVVCTFSSTDAATCPPATDGIGIRAASATGEGGPAGVKVFNGTVRGMGGSGIFITGLGSSVEKVTADGNGGFGMIVAGRVVHSSANINGQSGIFATTVGDSNANNNHLDGITLDAAGGVSIGNVASFNGRNGILAPNGTVTGNTVVRNVAFGISATCPSSIVANTVVGNTAGSIDTSRDGCVVVNNATRP
jgi:hypothetical protein